MPRRKRLPYPWLRNLQLIPPLFEAGDEVRILWDGAVRVCYPKHHYQRWFRPSVEETYTVNRVDFFQGRTKNLTGYKVELVEHESWWFWAHGFIKNGFSGWTAPASDLTRVTQKFYQKGSDYSVLWRTPCGLCQSPMRWRLPGDGPECRCGVCRYLPRQVKSVKEVVPAIIEGLAEFLRNLDIIAPGKFVRPIGPGVFPAMLDSDIFIEPLDVRQEYLVADFLRGDPNKVLLHGARGAYSTSFLEVI